MRHHGPLHVLKVILLIAALLAGLSAVVMGLWNILMPAVFGLHAIGYWQALGLLVLSHLFFGGFRGHPGHHRHWRHHMMQRWAEMTPEERERFRAGLRAQWPEPEPPAAEPEG